MKINFNTGPVTFLSFFVLGSLFSQTMVGGDAVLKFGESKNDYNYSEVLMNMNVDHDNFSTWFQFEFSEPPELGKNMNGLRKFRADYANGPLEISVGDIYKIWGRGLILNQFDDQGVNLDNGYRGLSFGLTDYNYSMNLIAGLSNISRVSTDFDNADAESRKPNHNSNHSLFGGDIELYKGPITLGLSSLQSREDHPLMHPQNNQVDSLNVIHRTHGFRGSYDGSSIGGYFEVARKKTLLTETNDTLYQDYFNPYNGFSIFGSFGYYLSMPPLDGWSLILEYKNYNYTKINPDDRNNFVKNYDMSLIYTQPPTSIREHSSVLLARLIPQVDFNDEVGYQAQIVGPVANLGNFTLNYQVASRSSLWEKTFPDTVNAALGSIWISDSSVTSTPYEEDVALPYNELYLEMEGYIQKIRYQFGFAWTNNISEHHAYYRSGQNGVWDEGEIFEDLDSNGVFNSPEPFSDHYSIVDERLETKYSSAFTIPTLLNYNLGNGWSIDVKYEFQKLKKGTKYFSTLSHNEVFMDANGNGIWDVAEFWEEIYEDGIWNTGEETWYDRWIADPIGNGWALYYDTDGDSLFDDDEWYWDFGWDGEPNTGDEGESDDTLQVGEAFIDLDGDGIWDDAEELEDVNGDKVWTASGTYTDTTGSNFYKSGSEPDQKIEEEFQYNNMFTIGIGKSPHWSLSLTVESSSTFEYGPQTTSITNPLEELMENFIDLENKWIALELMINVNSSTRLDLMYGTQRGGVVCSNGICRFVQPFDDGFKLNLTTIF